MITHKKELKFKMAMALQSELNDLYHIKHTMPSIPLEVPIFAGYKKFFVLRDDISRSDEAECYAELLTKCNRTVYCQNKSFQYRRKKVVHTVELHLRPIFRTCKFEGPAKKVEDAWFDNMQKYLRSSRHVLGLDCHTSCRAGSLHYHVTRPWVYDTKIEEYHLTHYREVDPWTETRIAEIRNKMTHLNLDTLLWGNRYSRPDDRDRDQKERFSDQLGTDDY